MPETTGAFKAYLEEMAKNGKVAGKSKKDGKLAVVLDELANEDNAVSESFSEDAGEDAAA